MDSNMYFRTKRSMHFMLALLVVVGITIGVAWAANPHYKPGGQPVCTIDTTNGTATCSAGSVAGLGNDSVVVTVSLTASAGTFCHNKGNPDNIVPGQNPAIGTGSSSQFFTPDQIKNGNLDIPAIGTSATVATPSWSAAGCENANWSVTLGTITYGPGRYSFQQPPGLKYEIQRLSFSF